MSKMPAPLTPPQIRAGRALLGWSQDELAAKAGVSLSTVRDYEKERRGGIVGGLKPIREALDKAGVFFIESDGDLGPGVRLRAIFPNVLRWPMKLGLYDEMLIPVEWRGKEYNIFVSHEILSNLGRFRESQPEAVYLRLYEIEREKILTASALAIDAGRAGPDGRVYLVAEDFPELR